jgi:hypothetical protein
MPKIPTGASATPVVEDVHVESAAQHAAQQLENTVTTLEQRTNFASQDYVARILPHMTGEALMAEVMHGLAQGMQASQPVESNANLIQLQNIWPEDKLLSLKAAAEETTTVRAQLAAETAELIGQLRSQQQAQLQLAPEIQSEYQLNGVWDMDVEAESA